MVATREWMLLWLAAVNFSQGPESWSEGSLVAEYTERELRSDRTEQLDQLALEPVRTSGVEHNDRDVPGLQSQHSTSGWPKKSEVRDEPEPVENPKSSRGRPLTEEEKADIRKRLAMHPKDLVIMKGGEELNNWFKMIMEREDLLDKYRSDPRKESNSTILIKLRAIQHGIKTVSRAYYREWGGVAGLIFEPKEEGVNTLIPEKYVHGPTDDLQSQSKVPFTSLTSPGMATQDLKTGESVEKISAEGQSLTEEAVPRDDLEIKKKTVKVEEEPKIQLAQHEINLVYEHITNSNFDYLKESLHDVTFHHWTTARQKKDELDEIRIVKLAFEKSILLAIQFIVKAKLSRKLGQEDLNKFLSSEQTLDIIGNHLVDLFHVVKHHVYSYLAFIPDAESLKDHWQTAYLKDIWDALGESQQAHVLRTAIKSNVRLYISFVEQGETTSWSRIIRKFNDQNLLEKFEKAKPGEIASVDDNPIQGSMNLDEFGKAIVNLYQNPTPDNLGENVPIEFYVGSPGRLRNEHILIYHILNFIKTYNESYLRSLFEDQDQIGYEIFKKQLGLYKQGLRVEQIIQQWKTYDEIINFPREGICTVSKDDAIIKKSLAENLYAKESGKYLEFEKQFKSLIQNNLKAKNWFDGLRCISRKILTGFESRATSLDLGLGFEVARRKELKELQWDKERWIEFYDEKYQIFYDSVLYPAYAKEKIKSKPPEKELLDLMDPNGFYL